MKRIVLLLLSLFAITSLRSESLAPIDLFCLTSQTNVNEIILFPEVDKFFINESTVYVNRIVSTKNCYLTKDGIKIGNVNSGGELSFSLKSDYRKAISRVFLQCIVPGDVVPTVTVNGVSEVIDAPANEVSFINFDVEIAESTEQIITLSSTSKIILDVITIIYSGSDAATGNVESIVVPDRDRTMNVGEESMIYSIVLPSYALDKSLCYSSSDETVATVDDNGMIHANRIGDADITVSSVSTPSVSAPISVKVVDIHPTAIDCVEQGVSIGVGGTFKFNLIFTPENALKDVEWSTEYGDYIDLDQNGVIKAKKEKNIASVIVTSKVNSKVSKSCVFSIVDNLPVSAISVTPEDIELEVGESIKASAEVSPRGASSTSVSWESTDPNIAKVDSEGTITGLSKGQCQVFAIAGDKDNEVRSPIPVRVVEFELSSIESIRDVCDEIDVKLDGRCLRVKGHKIGELLQMFDMEGRCISTRVLNDTEATISLPARKVLIVKIGNSRYKIY